MSGIYRDTRSGKNKGSWYFVINLGKDSRGVRRRIKKGGFKSREEAEIARAKALANIREEDVSFAELSDERSKVYYKDFLKRWFSAKRSSLERTTARQYEIVINNHIIPFLGKYTLSEINAFLIQDFISYLISKGLKPTTIKKIYAIMRSSIIRAFSLNLISKNPLADSRVIDLPKIKRASLQVWDENQVRLFLEEAKKRSRYYIAFYLALSTGMRQGEILGLRWQDTDLERGIIYVRQTVTHDGKEIKPGAKTKAGIRQIRINHETIEVLKEHKQKQLEEKQRMGDRYKDNDLVVCTVYGTITKPKVLMRAWYAILKHVDVPKISFHGLRHTHASLLLKAGVHPKVVQERLGHGSIQVTQDIYSHLFPSMQREAVEKIKGFFLEDEEDLWQESRDDDSTHELIEHLKRLQTFIVSKITESTEEKHRKDWAEALAMVNLLLRILKRGA